VIVLIGTNDLGHGRPPALAAQGIRAVLLKLRTRLPATRILLLGLWPRGVTPEDRLRREVGEVNRMIARCADGTAIAYADIGSVLLGAHGDLTRAISPDTLHFSSAGYARLAPRLDPLVDRLLRAR
jgi:beta-glucosidase